MSNPYSEQNPYGQQQPYGQQPPAGFDPNAAYGYQAPQAPVLAHWGLRFVSGLIDNLIIGIPGYLLGQAIGAGVMYLVVLIGWVALGYMEGTTGQTPGKKVIGTKLVKEADGQLVGAGLGIGRKFLHIIDGLPCYLGYLWPAWDAKKQTFADKIVSTLVIVSK